MGTINKPNLVLPLASSYNERGSTGFTTAITNSIDQRKVNCYYEITKNSTSGNSSLSLSKRPGVTSQIFAGTSTQAAYLITQPPPQVATLDVPIIFNTLGNDVRASDSLGTNTLFSSSAGYWPSFVDHTLISNLDTVVVQSRTVSIGVAHKVFFTSTSLGAAFTQISDGDFTGITGGHRGKMEHMDGYALIMGGDNSIYNSDLNSLANWTAGNFVVKQIKQDIPVGLMKFQNQILASGFSTTEVFYNAGNSSGSPLSPIKQLTFDVGISSGTGNLSSITSGSRNYYAVIGDPERLYFLGQRSTGTVTKGVYSYNGSTVEKISTPFIDKIIAEQEVLYIVPFFFLGNTAVAFAFDNVRTANQRWLMFFPKYNEWFEWNSSRFAPMNNGRYFLSSNNSGVYQFATSAIFVDDFGGNEISQANYQYMTQFSLPDKNPNLKRMGMFGVNGDTSSAGAGNTILVEFSDDDYQSFKTAGTISLSSDNKTLKRGGAYRNRAVRLSNTNAVETRLQSFIALVK